MNAFEINTFSFIHREGGRKGERKKRREGSRGKIEGDEGEKGRRKKGGRDRKRREKDNRFNLLIEYDSHTHFPVSYK